MNTYDLVVSAPGRMCLFGEHQDYFGLSIIAAAADLRLWIAGRRRNDRRILIDLPDVGEKEEIDATRPAAYTKARDYLKSGVNVLSRHGVEISGWDCLVHGRIPINAGTSSSSALCVAWVKFLLEAAGDARASDPEALAELAFQTEVAEFHEPGGRMDHYAAALGRVVCLRFGDRLELTQPRCSLGPFVLADSLQKKDTTGMLAFVKGHVLRGLDGVRTRLPGFNLETSLNDGALKTVESLPSPEERRLLKGTLLTRDLAAEGKKLFQAESFDERRFGELLSRQHAVLRDYLQISTPKIETMLEAALSAGALGGKINGSGGGGCMFAYAPENAERAAAAVERVGGRVYIVRPDDGARREDPRLPFLQNSAVMLEDR